MQNIQEMTTDTSACASDQESTVHTY